MRWAALVTLLGATLLLLGMTQRSTAGDDELGVLDLHNDRADSSSCSDAVGPSWHFVIAPNDGTYAFRSISLVIAGTLQTFSRGKIIANSGQGDNVFVLIPSGFSASDLVASGSFAQITPPPDGNVKFVLSSFCAGDTSTTVPVTTVPATSTTVASTTTVPINTSTTTVQETTLPSTTTSPSTTMPGTLPSTSIAGSTTTTSTTSTTSPGGPLPPPPTIAPTSTSSTTTSTVASGGPTPASTTTTPATTTTTSSSSTSVPSTSSTTSTTTIPSSTTTTVPVTTAVTGSGGGRVLIMVGSVLIIVGISLLIGAHNRRNPAAL